MFQASVLYKIQKPNLTEHKSTISEVTGYLVNLIAKENHQRRTLDSLHQGVLDLLIASDFGMLVNLLLHPSGHSDTTLLSLLGYLAQTTFFPPSSNFSLLKTYLPKLLFPYLKPRINYFPKSRLHESPRSRCLVKFLVNPPAPQGPPGCEEHMNMSSSEEFYCNFGVQYLRVFMFSER